MSHFVGVLTSAQAQRTENQNVVRRRMSTLSRELFLSCWSEEDVVVVDDDDGVVVVGVDDDDGVAVVSLVIVFFAEGQHSVTRTSGGHISIMGMSMSMLLLLMLLWKMMAFLLMFLVLFALVVVVVE